MISNDEKLDFKIKDFFERKSRVFPDIFKHSRVNK